MAHTVEGTAKLAAQCRQMQTLINCSFHLSILDGEFIFHYRRLDSLLSRTNAHLNMFIWCVQAMAR